MPDFPFEPGCGCAGCHDRATKIVQHPEYGRRAVCEEHSRDYPVVELLE